MPSPHSAEQSMPRLRLLSRKLSRGTCGLHPPEAHPTQRDWRMVPSKEWALLTRAPSSATCQLTQMALVSTREKNSTWKLVQAPMSGQLHGKIRLRDTESAVSTCHRESMFTATQQTRAMVSAGESILAQKAISDLHSWGGAEAPMTLGTMCKWTSEDSRMLLLSLRPWVGDTTSSTHTTDGTHRRTTPITSNGKDHPRKKNRTIETTCHLFLFKIG